VLLNKNGKNPVICDFGMSREFDQSLLMSTYLIGTPSWTAPEILRREKYDNKCDVYSFALILWEMLSNSIPYQEITSLEDLKKQVGILGYRPKLTSAKSDVIANLIMICWDQDPLKRPSFSKIRQFRNGDIFSEFIVPKLPSIIIPNRGFWKNYFTANFISAVFFLFILGINDDVVIVMLLLLFILYGKFLVYIS